MYLSLLTLLPLTPTLFPYTTLFRSATCLRAVPHARPASLADAAGVGQFHRRDAAQGPRRALCRLRHHGRAGARDRQSTRLNSSHLGISYAVFCLKKKTTIRNVSL